MFAVSYEFCSIYSAIEQASHLSLREKAQTIVIMNFISVQRGVVCETIQFSFLHGLCVVLKVLEALV